MLKTFVTFLIATPSPVWLFVAALHEEFAVSTSIRSKLEGVVSGIPYYPICALAKFFRKRQHFMLPVDSVGEAATLLSKRASHGSRTFRHIVPLVDDKLLVEDFKHLAIVQVRHGCGGRSSRAGCRLGGVLSLGVDRGGVSFGGSVVLIERREAIEVNVELSGTRPGIRLWLPSRRRLSEGRSAVSDDEAWAAVETTLGDP